MKDPDLFDSVAKENQFKPLAAALRPQTLDDYVGQEELIGKEGPIRQMIVQNQVPSMIFWGPPGCGKTTLAYIIAKDSDSRFISLSAVSSGKKDIERVVNEAGEYQRMMGRKTILFLDEIHRFNKAQQDFLLPYVEEGTITLIGATTENPSFEVISALLSRCRVFIFKEHSVKDLDKVLTRAREYLKAKRKISLMFEKGAKDIFLEKANGDPRSLLNILEIVIGLGKSKSAQITISKDLLKQALQTSILRYDKAGEEHYNVISAFIKSMRASDANAAVYWLARMIEAGEEPTFIARRCIVLASEDIGNAAPTALVLANAAFDAVHKVGWPEARIVLSQLVIYLSNAPKDNTAVSAISKAQEDAQNTMNLAVPMHLRNAPTKLMKGLGYGEGYVYDHDVPGKKSNQQCLPDKLKHKKYV